MNKELPLIPEGLLPYIIVLTIILFIYNIWPWPIIRLYFFRRRFFRAILRVTSINDSSNAGAKNMTKEQLIKLSSDELKLDFKKLIEKHGRFKTKYRNVTDLFEECIYYIDTNGSNELASMTDLTIANDTRAKVLQIIDLAKNENPFLGLPSKEANLLSVINQAITDGNKELGRNSLIQLSQELEQAAVTMETQEKRNIVSYIISIVGVILTIIFGLISLKSFF